jgi:ParB-like chromosome segregation protein Spo0J
MTDPALAARLPQPKRQMLPIDDVIPNPRNDNVHPQSQIDLLEQSIRRFGQPQPILVRLENRMIIAGHGIHLAMRQAGESEVDTLLWDVDQKTADAFLVADNRFSELSRRDPDRTRELLDQLREDEDFAALGFLPAEVEKLFEDEGDPIEVREINTDPVNDVFYIMVRGPLAMQALALKRLQEVMVEIPDIEVDLGTTLR